MKLGGEIFILYFRGLCLREFDAENVGYKCLPSILFQLPKAKAIVTMKIWRGEIILIL
jgi:hypothetical protein